MQENADDLEYQAKEDNDAITQDVKEDTVDSEQEAKEETNLENNLCSTTELSAIEDKLLALVRMCVM